MVAAQAAAQPTYLPVSTRPARTSTKQIYLPRSTNGTKKAKGAGGSDADARRIENDARLEKESKDEDTLEGDNVDYGGGGVVCNS